MLNDLLQVIEEQADVIMSQSDRICRLSRLLLEKFEVEQAELDSIVRKEKGEQNE